MSRPSVLSTVHRRGRTAKPLVAGSRRTMCMSMPKVAGGLDALGVDDAGGRLLLASFLAADSTPQQTVELVEDAFRLPAGEVGVDGVPVRVVVRQVAPGDAGAVHVEDRVQQAPQVVVRRSADVQAAATALGPPCGQHWLDQGPPGIGQVARVPAAFGHDLEVPARARRAHRHPKHTAHNRRLGMKQEDDGQDDGLVIPPASLTP